MRTDGQDEQDEANSHFFAVLLTRLKSYFPPTQFTRVFCVDLRTNSDYYPIQH